jgi:hypothetical protein
LPALILREVSMADGVVGQGAMRALEDGSLAPGPTADFAGIGGALGTLGAAGELDRQVGAGAALPASAATTAVPGAGPGGGAPGGAATPFDLPGFLGGLSPANSAAFNANFNRLDGLPRDQQLGWWAGQFGGGGGAGFEGILQALMAGRGLPEGAAGPGGGPTAGGTPTGPIRPPQFG